MKYINKIELQGVIGSISITKVGDKRVANFSLCTEYTSRSKDGCAVVECTWHNCIALEGGNISTETMDKLDKLDKGVAVHAEGRLRCKSYTTADGENKRFIDIFVNKLDIIKL